MQIDFTALNKLSQEPTQPQEPPQEPQKQISFTGNDSTGCSRSEAIEAQESPAAALQNGNSFQRAVVLTELIEADILKGLKQGEDIYTLFMQACSAISVITNNTLFFNQVEQDIITVYGSGMLEQKPLKMDLEATQRRLEKLISAEIQEHDPEQKTRINAAVRAHRAKIEQLQRKLATE